MIAQRILAVVSAVLLVGAVAVVLLAPPGMPLAQALLSFDHGVLEQTQSVVLRIFGPWLWTEVVMPLLVRPAWLPPVAFGLICGGLSLTLPHGRRAERPRQRRF